MTRYIPIFMALLLGACGLTPQGNIVRDAVKNYGAKVYDEGLKNAEWYMCEAASVGSVKRRYSGGRADSYNDLCDRNGSDIVK